MHIVAWRLDLFMNLTVKCGDSQIATSQRLFPLALEPVEPRVPETSVFTDYVKAPRLLTLYLSLSRRPRCCRRPLRGALDRRCHRLVGSAPPKVSLRHLAIFNRRAVGRDSTPSPLPSTKKKRVTLPDAMRSCQCSAV